MKKQRPSKGCLSNCAVHIGRLESQELGSKSVTRVVLWCGHKEAVTVVRSTDCLIVNTIFQRFVIVNEKNVLLCNVQKEAGFF